MSPFTCYIILLLACVHLNNSARILGIVPTPSYSHQIIFQPLWKELAKRGHDLVVLTANPINDKTISNLKEVDWSETYEIWNKNIANLIDNWNPLIFLGAMKSLFFEIQHLELTHPDVQKLIHNESEHFDLVINEHIWPQMGIFKHRYKCPLIGITTLGASNFMHSYMGNPAHYILYPDASIAVSEEFTFLERLKSVVLNKIVEMFLFYVCFPMSDELMKNIFGNGYPTVEEILLDTDMLFTNVNPIFSDVRPLTPSTITIGGGMHIKPPKPLPEELKEFLDEAKEGVIYFSLGSNVKSKDIKVETREVILNTFAQIPFKVLWKFEAEDLPGKPDNVKIMKWVPQQDVLRHPNVKVFVSQCGLQSLEEALFSHVPILGLPFFGDQEYNAGKVERSGIGRSLDYKTLSIENFKEALLDIINNPKYKEKTINLANLVRDEPIHALEKAVWWIEYVIRNKGAQHLKGPARNMPTYQYYYLDVISFLIILNVIIFGSIYYVSKRILTYIYKKCFKTKQKTQ